MAPLFTTIYRRIVRETLVPLAIMIGLPNLTILLPYIVVHKNGNLYMTFANENILQVLKAAWNKVDWFDSECWLIVVGTFVWALVTQITLPGSMYYGPPTRNQFRPQYWHNGFLYYILSMTIALPLVWHFSMLHLYYKFITILGILNFVGWSVSVLAFAKGLTFPDFGEHDRHGNLIFDFFCGIELYPHLGKYVSIKLLSNSRFGVFIWQLLLLIIWKAHYELNYTQYSKGEVVWPMTVATIVQTVYLAKAYYWEDGYMQSLDIAYDRFGYYSSWGCIAFLSSAYLLPNLYFVQNYPRTNFDALVGIASLLLGLTAVLLTYWVDYQRQVVRQTDGKCTIWGMKPVLIRAKYCDEKGQEQNAVLLASGFWGLGRHLNYLFEYLVFLAVVIPTLLDNPIPYILVIFMAIFIGHRTFRDDAKCGKKYGQYWNKYCKLVPYKLIPGLF